MQNIIFLLLSVNFRNNENDQYYLLLLSVNIRNNENEGVCSSFFAGCAQEILESWV
jgi:hypothetical protein